MNGRSRYAVAGLAVGVALAACSLSRAAPIAWSIDETQSSVSLAIADTAVDLDGTAATIRIRNPSGSNNGPWNVGNSAFLDGTLYSNYNEGGTHDIEFLPHAPGDIVGLPSGNYRPNPASWDPNAINADNPNGQYSNTTLDPAVFGARVRASVSILTVDAGYLAIDDVSYDAQSPVLPVTGATGGTFAASSMNFGILESLIYFDGLSIIIVGQPIPDTFAAPFDNFISTNNSAGLATIDDLGGLDRRVTIPINMVLALDIEGIILNAAVTGQIVATTTLPVPEPSTFLLSGAGAIALLAVGRRRMRRTVS